MARISSERDLPSEGFGGYRNGPSVKNVKHIKAADSLRLARVARKAAQRNAVAKGEPRNVRLIGAKR